jgi:hypothetical protein
MSGLSKRGFGFWRACLVMTFITLPNLLSAEKKSIPQPQIIKKKLGPDFFKKSEEKEQGKTVKIGISDYKVLKLGESVTLKVEGLIPQHILIPQDQIIPGNDYTLYVGLYDFESFQVGISRAVKYGSNDLEADYDQRIDWVEKRYNFKYESNSSVSNQAFYKTNNKVESPPQAEEKSPPPIFHKTITLDKNMMGEHATASGISQISMTDWHFSDQFDPTDFPQASTVQSDPQPSQDLSGEASSKPKPSISKRTSSSDSATHPTFQHLALLFRRESPSKRGTLAFTSPITLVLSLEPTPSASQQLYTLLSEILFTIVCFVFGLGKLTLGKNMVLGIYRILVEN